MAALCGNCGPDRSFGLDVCSAPSQDGRLSESGAEMARLCRDDHNRLRLCYSPISADMGQANVLAVARSFLRHAFRLGSVPASESADRALGALSAANSN